MASSCLQVTFFPHMHLYIIISIFFEETPCIMTDPPSVNGTAATLMEEIHIENDRILSVIAVRAALMEATRCHRKKEVPSVHATCAVLTEGGVILDHHVDQIPTCFRQFVHVKVFP